MEGVFSCNFRCTADTLAGMGAPFRHRLRVRWAECDQQGVVFYANYLAYFDVAMTELWREAVGPYEDMIDGGADMVVADAQITYRASARFDDEVDLLATVTAMGQTSMTTDLAVARAPDGTTLAEGRLRHVFVDPATMAKRSIPEAVRTALEPYSATAPDPA